MAVKQALKTKPAADGNVAPTGGGGHRVGRAGGVVGEHVLAAAGVPSARGKRQRANEARGGR